MSPASEPLEAGLRTDAGPRPENQDAAIAVELADGRTLAAVADGMGGLRAGAEASRRTLRHLEDALREGKGLVDAIAAAHAAVQELAETDAAGSTVVAALVSAAGVEVAHVGDSRAYRCGGLGLVPLTRDHTVAAEAEARGELAAREVAGSRWGATLARALGTRGPVTPEALSLPPLDPGEWLLLTSDGVHGVLEDREIERLVAGAKAPDELAAALIAAAVNAGTEDNLTAVVVRSRVAGDRASEPRPRAMPAPEPELVAAREPRAPAPAPPRPQPTASPTAAKVPPRDAGRERTGAARRSPSGPAWDPTRMVQRSSNAAPRRRWFLPGIFAGVVVVAVVLVAVLVLL